MNRLIPDKRSQVIAGLAEGNSTRSTIRMTGVAKNTIWKLLVELGAARSKVKDKSQDGRKIGSALKVRGDFHLIPQFPIYISTDT